MRTVGPQNLFSQNLHAEKYRAENESFEDYAERYSRAVSDSDGHRVRLLEMTREQRLLPGGRQQRAVGTPHQITALNCFVGPTIEDSMDSIMETLKRGAETMRAGGGIGWDFSTLRPEGEIITKLGDGAFASGPTSFMSVFDAMCTTIMSGGRRRGAMMGVLRVDHPDVRKFVRAKRTPHEVQVLWDLVETMPDGELRMQAAMALQKTLKLTSFNISLAVTDEFIEAVNGDRLFTLKFGDKKYGDVRALDLWSEIMESNWDWAEPGVLFIDRINQMNPLGYCEKIRASNPCAEQVLPPNGACLLSSHNIVKYLVKTSSGYSIDYEMLGRDVRDSVRAADNVIDRSFFPLREQQDEAFAKRRMGIGYTGMANAIETMGHPYGSDGYIAELSSIHRFMTNEAYRASIQLAREKGSFPMFDADGWLSSGWAKSGSLDEDVLDGIRRYGLRNGLLVSIAPGGSISLVADNVSASGEPVFAVKTDRMVNMRDGKVKVELNDYAYTNFGTIPRTADQVSPEEHIKVLCAMQRYTDSSVSKTCNVAGRKTEGGPGITFDEFKDIYMQAYKGGAKGCTTFNVNGKRMGILTAKSPKAEIKAEPKIEIKIEPKIEIKIEPRSEHKPISYTDGAACYWDPKTGTRSCEL